MHLHELKNVLFGNVQHVELQRQNLINFKLQRSGYSHEIFWISKLWCWIPQRTHNLSALAYWQTCNRHRHSGYRRYRWPFQRPIKHWWKDTVCSRLAMHRGHNRAPFNSCVCQSECACMFVRQNRGGGLSEKVKGGCCFPSVWYYQRAGPCIPQVNTRQQSLDDTMQRFSFVPKAASRPRAQTVTFSLEHWQKDSLKKQDIMKMYLKVKLKMYGMNKKLKNKENMLWFWSKFDTKSFLLERKKYFV